MIQYLRTIALVIALLPFDAVALPMNGVVSDVIESSNIRLESGEEVHLAGILIPGSYTSKATALLNDTIKSKKVFLRYGVVPVDHNQRFLAHIFTTDGTWAQSRLLEAGYALIYAYADNDILVNEMRQAEHKARTARVGLWDDKNFQVFTAENILAQAETYRNQFVMVEGTVYDVADTKGRVYLNFAEDWKTDFSASIPKEYQKTFKLENFKSMKGKKVLVRGWLDSYNGPIIELTHSSQIEVE